MPSFRSPRAPRCPGGPPLLASRDAVSTVALASGCSGTALADSAYEVCPLCGLGEAGSEHFLEWCPA
eukprot:1858614-Lingulodinium_polyedra.AAC.1